MKHFNTLVLSVATVAFGFAQEMVVNGDFETGDTTGWSGNAANVVTENGNSYNQAIVEAAGNPWDVNLSQSLVLEPEMTYTLTFDAWSDGTRTLIAGIGLNEGDYASATETVTLSNDVQTYTLSLTAPATVNANSRVLFDMGADVGFVGIDNVSLMMADGGTTPTPTAMPEVAAPTPTRAEQNVVSIFSDAYTDIAVDEWGPDWGPSSSRITDTTVAGDATKVFDVQGGQEFAGISFVSSTFDASNYDIFHIDYWVAEPLPAGQLLQIKLSNHKGGNGESNAILYSFTPQTSGWNSLDINLADFIAASEPADLDRSAIAQIVLVAPRANNAEPVKFYLDNIYFYQTNLSVSDVASSKRVKVYPNPAKGGDKVMVSGDVESVSVYSAAGNWLRTSNQQEFSTQGLAKGVYFLQIQTKDGKVENKKLLVK